jgi:catechol 2,3-dioxygenase-like lactoylglutathione lyase family enzyme
MRAEVHHVGLTVGDLDRSVEWYSGNFTLREVARNHLEGELISQQTDLPSTRIDVSLLAGSNTIVELLCYRNPVGRPNTLRTCDVGAAHVCIVVDDLDATCRAMQRRGVTFHADPCSLIGEERMMYVRDPDGIMVELLQTTPDITTAALLAMADD